MSASDELSSNTSFWSFAESLPLVREGDSSFYSLVQPYQVEHLHFRRGRTRHNGKNEDDEGAIRFATLQSRFENKESFRNWLTIKPFALATLTDLTTAVAVVYKSHTLSTSFNERHVLVVSNSISLFCLEGRVYVR